MAYEAIGGFCAQLGLGVCYTDAHTGSLCTNTEYVTKAREHRDKAECDHCSNVDLSNVVLHGQTFYCKINGRVPAWYITTASARNCITSQLP